MSLTAWSKYAKADTDTIAAWSRQLKVAAATCNRKLGVVVQGPGLLRGHVAAGRDRGNTTEARACKMSEKILKLRAFVKRLN